jgi:hypothetical protein
LFTAAAGWIAALVDQFCSATGIARVYGLMMLGTPVNFSGPPVNKRCISIGGQTGKRVYKYIVH